jgi:uncharacterized protein
MHTRLVIGLSVLLLFSGQAFAQATDAPGDLVTIPGSEISGWGKVDEVQASFGLPKSRGSKVPVVLILHGSGGVDGRGAFYAEALQQAGVGTLEIKMFPLHGRPKTGSQATMPHAAAALQWLAVQPNVDPLKLGVIGFSWGGGMSVLMSSTFVQERMGERVPKPAAFVSLYPVCTNMARNLMNPERAFYKAHTRMSASPMLIIVGTRDDNEEKERACDELIAMWPPSAREQTTVRYVEGATHGFDAQRSSFQYYDNFARGGRGAMVTVTPSPKDAAEVRGEVVNFFLKYLKP